MADVPFMTVKPEPQNVSDNWLENQSELYQAAYLSIENLDDDAYQQNVPNTKPP